MRERFAKTAQPSGSDAAHVREIGVSRSRDGLEAAETTEHGARGHCRDLRNGCENGFCRRVRCQRLRTLRVRRPVGCGLRPCRSASDSVDPQGRVGLGFAPDDRDPVLAGGEERAADRGRRDRPFVEGGTLDEQDRMPRGGAETAELSPETAGRQCAVQIAHGLPLDERMRASVVADRQLRSPNFGAETRQLVPNAARLVNVDLDANHLNPHAKIVPPKPSRECAYRSREARTK